MNDIKTIGILGAGKVGIVLAQLALKAGYKVLIAASGDPVKITLTTKILTPGAAPLSSAEVAEQADVIILALPLSNFRTIPKEALAGKLVIDAMNHWWEVDGDRADIIPAGQSSSEAVQSFLETARVVKAFSHTGYHELHDTPKPAGDTDRKAIAVAGDNEKDITIVANIIDSFGFDPLPIGALHEGRRLEPGQPAFGANTSLEKLKLLVSQRT